MDPERFDALSRSVARGTSRRRMLAFFGAAGLAGALAACGGGDGDDPTATAEGRRRATKTPTGRPRKTPTARATRTPTEDDNGDRPTRPSPTDPPLCQDGFPLCGGRCVDRQSDFFNCGECGHTCRTDPEEECIAGECAPVPQPCNPSQNACDGRCVEVMTDPDNCGRCGFTCAADGSEECVAGECRNRCELRTDGFTTDCGGVCVDTQSDSENCGTCGVSCGPSEMCRDATCRTIACGEPGETSCPPDGDCVDLQTSFYNCGQCGNVCGFRETCTDGTCGRACEECADTSEQEADKGCAPDQHYCDERCVNNDVYNCNACGYACPGPSFLNATVRCVAPGELPDAPPEGGCLLVCDEGFFWCGGDYTRGCEFEEEVDPLCPIATFARYIK